MTRNCVLLIMSMALLGCMEDDHFAGDTTVNEGDTIVVIEDHEHDPMPDPDPDNQAVVACVGIDGGKVDGEGESYLYRLDGYLENGDSPPIELFGANNVFIHFLESGDVLLFGVVFLKGEDVRIYDMGTLLERRPEGDDETSDAYILRPLGFELVNQDEPEDWAHFIHHGLWRIHYEGDTPVFLEGDLSYLHHDDLENGGAIYQCLGEHVEVSHIRMNIVECEEQ